MTGKESWSVCSGPKAAVVLGCGGTCGFCIHAKVEGE